MKTVEELAEEHLGYLRNRGGEVNSLDPLESRIAELEELEAGK